MHESILLVEDEQRLRTTLAARLKSAGYVVDAAADGVQGLEKALDSPFDLIILDLTLPERNGLDICRDIRQAGLAIPILILTVRAHTVDKVVALKLGADDYVTKPFAAAELMARIEALLRRVPIRDGSGVQEIGPLRVDLRRMQVTLDSQAVYLTVREFQLLRYLIERSGSTVPRTELLRSVWGYDGSSFTRTVDMHVSSLRKKLERDPAQPKMIVTVPNVGYRFVVPRKAAV